MYYNNNDTILESCIKVAFVPILGGIMGIVGILINILIDVLVALPFWLFWTVFGIGSKYFYFLPDIYHSVSLWHCIGIFLCIGMFRMIFVKSSTNVNTKSN